MDFVLPPPPVASAAIAGATARFPVHRIYCVGRNYAEHAREIGMPVERGTPMFFCKPADALVEDGAEIAYPLATHDFHHEVEMVVALHGGGTHIPPERALEQVFGYAVGLDLTRRDLQIAARNKGHPWDTAKAFDHSAPLSAIHRASETGHPAKARLTLEVNGKPRQDGDIADMLFDVPSIIHELSKLFELKPGDLIYTGTPSGIAAFAPGDSWHARLDGIAELRGSIARA